MLFTTDENNVFGKSLKEAGTYNVRVTSAVAKNSKSGNPMIEFNYEVLDGQYAGAPIRYDYAVWNDDEDHFDLSVRRFNTIMIASGIPSGKAVENLPQVASVMNGRKLAVSVDWEQSQNGNWYLRVKSYHKLLQEGSQPNGKTRPESSQNSRQSNFGGNRGQTTGYRQQAPQAQNSGFNSQASFNAAMPTNGQQQRPQQPQQPNADELPF